MERFTKRISLLLIICLTAGALCGFTALPPENWESIDPKFHLAPPGESDNGVVSGSGGNGNIVIIQPSADGTYIPILPHEENSPRLILLYRANSGLYLPK